MRLLISCSELGFGHASRITLLGKKLEKHGHKLFFFAGDKIFHMLKNEFKTVNNCTSMSWYENRHGIITSATLINLFFPLPLFNMDNNRLEIKNSIAMEMMSRYYHLREGVHNIAPDMLVSDGDLGALPLANRWKIPLIYIANMIRPSYGFPVFLNPIERFVEFYMKCCSKIVIPDNPPPFTVSEYNIGNIEKMGLNKKVEFVGSFVDTTYVSGSQQHILASVTGSPGTKAKVMKVLLPVLEKLPTKCIISLGNPGKKASAKIGNCEFHTWLFPDEWQEYMKNAKFVIFSGGHATCFETIKYAKPSICIPTQPEQLGNAAKLQDLNCSIIVKTKKDLENAIRRMENEQARFSRNISELNKFSSKLNGLDSAVAIIENLGR